MNIQNLISKTKTDKIKFLSEQAIQDNALIIALTETHLSEKIVDAEIHIPNYTIYRQDREGGRKHGGIATYVHNSISAHCELIKTYSNNFVEFNIIRFTKLDMLLVNIYRPPECPCTKYEEALQEIRSTTSDNSNRTFPYIIITGDLNFPKTNWSTGETVEASAADKQQADALVQLASVELLCTQHIKQPTRNNNILDLFFTNTHELVRDIRIENTVASDHNVITVETNLNYTQKVVHPNKDLFFNKLNFHHKNTDWAKIQSSINETCWDTTLRNKNTTEQNQILQNICLEICTEHTPRRNKRNNKQRIPRERKTLMREKRKIAKKIKSSANANAHNIQAMKQKMIRADAKIQDSINNERLREEMKIIETIPNNTKSFFDYAKKKSKIKTGIGPLRNEANETVEDPRLISEMFKQQYESVFTQPDPSKVVTNPHRLFSDSGDDDLTDIIITEESVITAIKTLKTHAAPGPDEFPAVLLKNCSKELAKPLTILYKNMLDTGIVPQDLKTAHITPIHKKGSKTLAKNYRPVALTSHLIKVLEKVIAKQLSNYLEGGNKMNPAQHGFRPGRSCLSQLLAHQNSIISSLQHACNIDVIYLDYSKAFDTVDHGILLHKMKNLGISGKLGIWISNFLQDRIQRVVIDGYKSGPSPVVSGVPQGSVLGPTLFNIHLVDIGQDVQNSTISSFADDTRIHKEIKTPQDAIDLQSDLCKVYRWTRESNMGFNGDKFELMRYGKRNRADPITSYLTQDGQPIMEKTNVRDLGVKLSNDAKFEAHIVDIVKKARCTLAWILRTFISRDKNTLLTLYKYLVRPNLEYCCQLWNPWLQKNINLIEGIQRTFTHKIQNLTNSDYHQRLVDLDLYSLERRRERYLIIHTWKILNGKAINIHTQHGDGIRYKQSTINSRNGRMCDIPPLIPSSPSSITTIKDNSFICKGPSLFNSLPSSIRDSEYTEIDQFKRELKKYLGKIPDKPKLPGCSPIPASSNSLIDWEKHFTAVKNAGGSPRGMAAAPL